MKTLMKILSLLLLIFAVIYVFTAFSGSNNTPYFLSLIVSIITLNILPIITIAICCLCIQRNDNSIGVRITLSLMFFTIILSILINVLPLNTINEDLYSSIATVYNFIYSTHVYFLVYSLLSVIQPNNVIAKTIKNIGLVAIIASILVQLWVAFKVGIIDTLPNAYDIDNISKAIKLFNTMESSENIQSIILIIEAVSIILSYITNYAFEEESINAEDLDFDTIKKQAELMMKNKIQDIYAPKVEEQVIDRSASEKGLMNVNNQLGVNSNVGQVSKSAELPTTFVDKAIPMSSGPVINNSANSDNNNTNNQN